MNIGEKIKLLRKKNDLTQEKLADYLCVSYQAVSKWETGISNPDLTLIAPLTKLLHVSADELLGLTDIEPDARRIELEKAHEKTWFTGNHIERMKIAETAVKEYPGDCEYLYWLADSLYYYALENHKNKEQNEILEKAVSIYKTVIEESTDPKIRNYAISGIVITLSWLYRFDEAKIYAELYPEKEEFSKDNLLMFCLTGEKKEKHQQKMLLTRFEELITSFYLHPDINVRKIEEQIIKLIITDENYLYFHAPLFNITIEQAKNYTYEGQYDEAISMLEKAYNHAIEYNKIAFTDQKMYKYTTPLLNMVDFDTSKWFRGTSGTFLDNFKEHISFVVFDPLREREDFKKFTEV